MRPYLGSFLAGFMFFTGIIAEGYDKECHIGKSTEWARCAREWLKPLHFGNDLRFQSGAGAINKGIVFVAGAAEVEDASGEKTVAPDRRDMLEIFQDR